MTCHSCGWHFHRDCDDCQLRGEEAETASRLPVGRFLDEAKIAPMPKTSKEKQEDYRARMALLGMKEVRGIYLPEHLHAELKKYAEQLRERDEFDNGPLSDFGGTS